MFAKSRILFFMIAVIAIFSSGCTYMSQRGNDAKDIFDIGFTVTPHLKPDFAIYLDFFGRTPIGGAYMEDARLLGVGARKTGWLKVENKSWGAIAWGSEYAGVGEFNPENPYQAREDQKNLTERPRWNTGFVRMAIQGDTPHPIQFAACDKGVHLGWIGFMANCRPLELIDFLLGWTTLDILDDDNASY